MAIIKEDEIGVYVNSGGWIARPVNPSQFLVGEPVKDYHFGGSPLHGIGKDASCKRGEYLETWIGCGQTHRDKTFAQRKQQYDWYMNDARTSYSHLFGAK